MSGELNRSRRLIAQAQRDQRAEELLALLPQGHGSGLDADLLDGLHAAEIIAKIAPRGGAGGGGSSGGPHAATHQPGGEDDLLGVIAGHMAPTQNLAFDIGRAVPVKRFRDLFIRNINASGNESTFVYLSAETLKAGTGGFSSSGDVVPTNPGANDLGLIAQEWRDIRQTGYHYSGKVSNLPTPTAAYRGAMIRVEGGAGEPDRVYMCMKGITGEFSWVMMATGLL